ncbi:MAG: ATP-binding protein [Alphaproteobacteria bacterium]|nr:ATP-binding protein [Alphaproteobacteria bacterium]
MDLSKIEAGKMEIENDIVDIPTLVDDAFLVIAEQAKNNNVRLHHIIENGLPNLRGSEVKLRQVLLNLLSNAVKCIRDSGQVNLTAQCARDGGISFSVADTGIGMSQADIAVAFEAFGQTHSKTSRRFDGAGLGLPLTKRLVELHGGDIHIESTEGVGTTVTVTLPASRAVAKTA